MVRQAKASATIEATGWWQRTLKDPNLVLDKVIPSRIRGFEDNYFREHYVIGPLSPFTLQHCHAEDYSEYVWAVHIDEFANNTMGMVQGGAIAAIFDFTTAVHASMLITRQRDGGPTVTASLSVEYLRPVKPLPRVVCVTSRVKNDKERAITIKATMAEAHDGRVFCCAESTIVALAKAKM